MVLFTKEYLLISVLYFLVLIFLLRSSLLRYHGFKCLLPIALEARLPVYALKKAHVRAINLPCVRDSQPDSFILFANLAALFTPDLSSRKHN